jgi:CRP-like cAMP-binding protein
MNWKETERRINLVIKTGNFNASKDKVPFYIILPNQRSKRIWDIFISLASVVNICIVTIDIGWNFECFTDMQTVSALYLIFTVVFFIDILFGCITAYLDDKNIYSFDLGVIISNYFQNGLIYDVLGSIPWDKLGEFDMSHCASPHLPNNKYVYFFFYLRLLRINKFFSLIEKIFSKYAMIIRLVKLFIFIILIANVSGNVFCSISLSTYEILYSECYNLYGPTTENFKNCANLKTKQNINCFYLYALYLGLLLTMGTDFSTNTATEQWFMIVIVIFSTIMNASIYGNVAVILGNISFGVSPILREKIDTMTSYMNFMKFDPMFTNQIQEYHLNIWFKQRNMMYEESFFGDMSSALHKIMLLIQYKPSFFIRNKMIPYVSQRFILDMVVLFEPKIYMTNDIIITEGESTCDVFFASETTYCKVYIGGQWVKDLMTGDYFGEIAIFLRSKRRTSTILCYRDSDFLAISGDNFQTLLRNYPEDSSVIKNRAVQSFISSVKFYSSNLFAKLVPNNKLKDYLFRKSIYLEDEEEDQILNQRSNHLLDLNEYNDKINQIVQKLTEVKHNLEKAKSH